MTRTSRAAHPRAVNKDRSISRTGYDKSIQKNGAGNHNWGSIDDELELEDEALSDEGLGDQQPDRDSITADAEGMFHLHRKFPSPILYMYICRANAFPFVRT